MAIPWEVTIIALSAGTLAAGTLLARHRIRAERQRAEAAESRARSYLGLLESLSTALPLTPATPSAAGAAEAARRVPENPARGGPLTDSRYLFVSFEEEIRRARQRGTPLTLLTLAVDNLRDPEDRGDPDTFDRLLRSVAHAVRGQMRGCDTCIRYAGDEFLLILPGVTREEARRVEGRLRVAVHGVQSEPRSGDPRRARASLGSATFPDDGGSFDQLLTLADSRRRQEGSAAPGPSASATTTPYTVPPPALSRN